MCNQHKHKLSENSKAFLLFWYTFLGHPTESVKTQDPVSKNHSEKERKASPSKTSPSRFRFDLGDEPIFLYRNVQPALVERQCQCQRALCMADSSSRASDMSSLLLSLSEQRGGAGGAVLF